MDSPSSDSLVDVLVIPDLDFENGKWKTSIDTSPFDIAKITTSKLLISGSLNVKSDTDKNLLSSILPKIYRCDIKHLCLWYQTLSYNDFLFLSSSVEQFNFCEGSVLYKNGSKVPFEKIVEGLPKVKSISYSFNPANPSLTASSFKKLIKLRHFSKLERIYLYDIPEIFDLNTFYAYMKKNKRTKIYLIFATSISVPYKKRIESIVDEILETQIFDYKIPCIAFPGLDSSKSSMLHGIFFCN